MLSTASDVELAPAKALTRQPAKCRSGGQPSRAVHPQLSSGLKVLMEVASSGPARLAAVGIAQGTASELADALVREGLLTRRADPSDRRAVLLEVTAEGQAHADRWRAAY